MGPIAEGGFTVALNRPRYPCNYSHGGDSRCVRQPAAAGISSPGGNRLLAQTRAACAVEEEGEPEGETTGTPSSSFLSLLGHPGGAPFAVGNGPSGLSSSLGRQRPVAADVADRASAGASRAVSVLPC